MAEKSRGEVTRLLFEISQGNKQATDDLIPLVYSELRRLARARLAREKPGQTLQPTALVHDAYLRLVEDPSVHWQNRAHFFAAAAEAMRRIVIERARRAERERHGGKLQRISLDEVPDMARPKSAELLALDDALRELELQDVQMASVVKLRYFAGLSVPDTAEALSLSPRTVNRLWTRARAWLYREMAEPNARTVQT